MADGGCLGSAQHHGPGLRPVRILHLNTSLEWRGTERQVAYLLRDLPREAFISVIAAPGPTVVSQRLSTLAPLVSLPLRRRFSILTFLVLCWACLTRRIDIIDAHTSLAHFYGVCLKRLFPRLRLVVHRRIERRPKDSRSSRWRFLSPLVDRFVAVSPAVHNMLIDYGVEPERVELALSAIEGTVSPGEARRTARAALAREIGIDPALPLIGNASHLTHQKGYETLLRAAQRLSQEGRHFHCVIAGDGELAAPLKDLILQLGLERLVTLVGFRSDVTSVLQSLDVLVVPSRFEALGTILLEGLYAGCSIAATRVGGIPEIIVDGETGLLSEVDNHETLSTNIARLLDDPELRQRLVTQGQAHIERKFSVARMVQRNADIYQNLMAPAP